MEYVNDGKWIHPKRRWQDNIGIDLREMGINTRYWAD